MALAFMDIMPRADGHVLVLPKSPARNILDVDPAMLGQLIARVQKIAHAVKQCARRGWNHHPAIQRARRWPGRVPSAFPHSPALGGRGRCARIPARMEKPEVLEGLSREELPRR